MKLLKDGKDKEALYEALDQLESTTKIDSIGVTGEKFVVETERYGGKLTKWAIKANNVSSVIKKTGKNFDSLYKEIDEYSFDVTCIDLEVLCHIDTNLTKTWDGKIESTWCVIDPLSPFNIVNEKVTFNTRKVTLTENSFNTALDTKIMLYDTLNDVYYILRPEALPSFGRLFDCAVLFSKAEYNLGTALLIADKMTKSKNMRFLYRNSNEKEKLILGVYGFRYTTTSQKDFFTAAFNKIAEKCLFSLKKWTITDVKTRVDIALFDEKAMTKFGIILETGDLSGIPYTLICYTLVENNPVYLSVNTISHRYAKDTNALIDNLFKGIWEEMLMFNVNDLKKIKANRTLINEEMLLKIIGKKKYIMVGDLDTTTAYDMFVDLIKKTSSLVNGKQKNQIRTYYRDVFYSLKKGEKIC